MQNTMDLLDSALKLRSAADWHKQLDLSRNALHSARQRGNLSPSIAGSLAEALGEDPQKWIVIAALEGERESACKTRMVRRFLTGAALTLGAVGTAAAKGVCILCKVVCATSSIALIRRLAKDAAA